jgi:hypothetical protein
MKCGTIGNHVPAKDSAARIILRLRLSQLRSWL